MKEQISFLLASNNPKKQKEMGDILAGLGIQVISMAQAGIDVQPEETGATFEENALIKAKAVCRAGGLPALADDSGLAVEALGGAPGVRSARYCPGTDWDRLEFLLKNMENVPEEKRGAKFVSAVACAWPDGRTAVWRGECPGVLLQAPRGQGGFGYDPIFYLPEYGQTFAEMSQQLKNKISHRARAMEQCAAGLAEQIKTAGK
jgi:XTP/dITP diphosphohydrolase